MASTILISTTHPCLNMASGWGLKAEPIPPTRAINASCPPPYGVKHKNEYQITQHIQSVPTVYIRQHTLNSLDRREDRQSLVYSPL